MSLYTIKTNGKHEIIIEKSRFICHLQRINDKEQAFDFIKSIKKQYWDATHNCSAFIIGESMNVQGSSDDGEPSGTAGIPMLEVLKKNNLHDVTAVVTRYFGGIKLGAGGLVRAYGKSVSHALQEVGIVRKILVGEYLLPLGLNDSGRFLNILYQQKNFQITEIEYTHQHALVHISFLQDQLLAIQEILVELLQQNIELQLVGTKYEEQDA